MHIVYHISNFLWPKYLLQFTHKLTVKFNSNFFPKEKDKMSQLQKIFLDITPYNALDKEVYLWMN